MSVECDIYFPTSFRTTNDEWLDENGSACFHTEGYCELYGASDLMDSVKKLNGQPVYIYERNNKVNKDPYGNQLFAYRLDDFLRMLEDETIGFATGSRKVCIAVLKSVLGNVDQKTPYIMAYFH